MPRLRTRRHVARRTGLCALVLAVLGAGVATPALANPTFPFPWTDYSVVPVFLVPTDWSTSSAEIQSEAASITSALADVQNFYRDSFNGRTFKLNALNVVQASGAKEAYGITWTGGNIYTDGVVIGPAFENLVVTELAGHGYPTPPAMNQAGYSTLVFVKGAGGFAGGRAYSGADGGHAILGDWAIDSLDGDVAEGAYWWSGRRLQTGATAHELGHTFGLDHPDSYGQPNSSSVMGNWWDFPTIGLNDTDKTRLNTNKGAWFTPVAPSNATATPLTGTSIRVNWADNSNNETGFQLYNGVSYVQVGPNVTSYIWSGLSPGAYMCFTVRALNGSDMSPATPYACTTTPTVPAAPSNPTATAVNGTSIRVTWADNSNNETGFQLFNGVSYLQVGANVTSYTWSGLNPGTYMCFSVRSLNGAGTSAATSYACTTTPTIPAAPSSPTATAVSGTSIRVTWADNSSNETGFQIFNGVSYVQVGANVTSYTWAGLSPNTYMCFSVKSLNLAGSSAATSYACTTTPTVPAAPSNQTATALSTSQIRVNWRDNSANETGFQIFDGVNYFTVSPNTTTFTRTGLASRSWWCFSVRSYNAAGYSAFTPYACTYTL